MSDTRKYYEITEPTELYETICHECNRPLEPKDAPDVLGFPENFNGSEAGFHIHKVCLSRLEEWRALMQARNNHG